MNSSARLEAEYAGKKHINTYNASRAFAREYNDAIATLNPGIWTAVYGERVVGTSVSKESLIHELKQRGFDSNAAVIRVFRKKRQRALFSSNLPSK